MYDLIGEVLDVSYGQSEVKISTLVGSHPHIVFMKEFVENADK
jgi:hypothetical protein